MKEVYKVWCDGQYITPEKAIKRHPEGFSTAFTKVEYVETFGDKVKAAAPTVINCMIMLAAAVIISALVTGII